MIAAQCAYKGGNVTVAVLPEMLSGTREIISSVKEREPNAKIDTVTIKNGILSEEDIADKEFSLLINATPIGMFPHPENMPCESAVVSRAKAVFDVIYNPKETLLSKTAAQLSIPSVTGMAMLVLQAAAAQEIWNGAKFRVDDLRELIADMEKLV